MSWDFRGANFHNSAVGPNARVYNGAAPQTELRDQLAELRTALAATEEPACREAVELVDELDGAVAAEDPDPEVVTGVWTRLRTAAMVALPTGANLAQIASLVNDLVSN